MLHRAGHRMRRTCGRLAGHGGRPSPSFKNVTSIIIPAHSEQVVVGVLTTFGGETIRVGGKKSGSVGREVGV